MEKTYRIRVKLKDFSRRFYHDDYQHSSPIFAKVGGNIERKKYKLKQYSYEGNFLIYDI
jgi:hypothetical protein